MDAPALRALQKPLEDAYRADPAAAVAAQTVAGPVRPVIRRG
jgi:hypothetical protein